LSKSPHLNKVPYGFGRYLHSSAAIAYMGIAMTITIFLRFRGRPNLIKEGQNLGLKLSYLTP